MLFGLLKSRARQLTGDVELGGIPIPFINGYPSASKFIADDPDNSFSIFNTFQRLTSRNLLYMEAELFELQKQQDILDIQDSHGDAHTTEYLRSWQRLSTSVEPRQVQRMELLMKIRMHLKEYQEALVAQQSILKMCKPQTETVETLKVWLDGKSEGPNGRTCASLSGLSADRLKDKEELVALHPPFERDWLSRLVQLPYLRGLYLHKDVDETIALYSMRKMNRAVTMLSMVVAAILLIVSIVTLYFVASSNLRLGLICAFTAAFALSINMLTNARRAEVFASTAAYAAVLVVFVSGNLGSPCCGQGG